MSINLSNRRDHAYLVLLAGEMRQQPLAPTGAPSSRRALMTAFCYSKIAGVPLDARFMIFPRGPISEEVLGDLEALEAADVLKNASLRPEQYAHLVPSTMSLQLAADYRTWIALHRETARQVLQVLAPLTPEHLDQVAAMHFLALQLKRQGSVDDGRVIFNFLAGQEEAGWNMGLTEAIALFADLVVARVIEPTAPPPIPLAPVSAIV